MSYNDISPSEEAVIPKTTKRPWGTWATAGLGCAVGFAFIATQIFVALVYAITKFVAVSPTDIMQFTRTLITDGLLLSLATIISGVIGSGLVLLFIKARGNYSLSEYLGFRRITRKTVLILLLITLAVSLISGLLGLLFDDSADLEALVNIYETSLWPPLLWLAIIIIAPVFEEIFFRGFLFTGFVRSRIGVSGTIALTTVIWTSLHLGQYGAHGLATIFVMGLVLGVARHKTGSLWSPLIMHVFFNLIAVIEVAYNVSLL